MDTPQEIASYTGGDRFVVLKTINLKDSDEILRRKLFRMGKRIKNTISQQMKFKVTIGIGEYHEDVQDLINHLKKLCRR